MKTGSSTNNGGSESNKTIIATINGGVPMSQGLISLYLHQRINYDLCNIKSHFIVRQLRCKEVKESAEVYRVSKGGAGI